MKVKWEGTDNGVFAVVGDYTIWLERANRGETVKWVWWIAPRGHDDDVLDVGWNVKREVAEGMATTSMFLRLERLYGDILEREDPTA